MKFAFLSLAILSSSLSFAHDEGFKRVQFENDTFRDWTREELENKLGEDKALLPYYVCNGQDEFDPFHSPLRSNPKKDSLKIKGYKSDEVVTYKEGKYFDKEGQELTDLSHDAFYRYVVKALARFEKLPSTSKLLRLLEESYFPLAIEFGGNSFIPYANQIPYKGIYMANAISFLETLRFTDETEALFYGIGVGGSIAWHPQAKVETIEADGKLRELDPEVAFAHEMYHAFDAIRGTLDQRFVQGENYEFNKIAEYRAVYFENLVRKDLGIRYRKYYSEKKGADLLDDKGEPIFISSPCLAP